MHKQIVLVVSIGLAAFGIGGMLGWVMGKREVLTAVKMSSQELSKLKAESKKAKSAGQ